MFFFDYHTSTTSDFFCWLTPCFWSCWNLTFLVKFPLGSPKSHFFRMRSKGSRFTLGGSQLFATVRDRPQPSATVRNRPREGRMAVPIVSSAKGVPLGDFQRRLVSNRAVGVALRDISPSLKTCQTWFCVAGAILLRRFQKMICSFRGRHNTLETSDVILRGRRSTLDVSCCVFSANCIVSAARSGDKVQIPWQAWWHIVTHEISILRSVRETSILKLRQVVTLNTPQSTLHALHLILCTLHSTLYTLHSTLYTPHFTLYTPHFTLYTPHFTLYTPHFTLHTLHFTPHTSHFRLPTPHFTLYTPHFTLHTLHFTPHTSHFRLPTPHLTLYSLHSTLYTLHCTWFTLHTQHSTLSTFHSTLYTPFLFSHDFDSGVPSHTCEHFGSWA